MSCEARAAMPDSAISTGLQRQGFQIGHLELRSRGDKDLKPFFVAERVPPNPPEVHINSLDENRTGRIGHTCHVSLSAGDHARVATVTTSTS
jgi:hypothetical protein